MADGKKRRKFRNIFVWGIIIIIVLSSLIYNGVGPFSAVPQGFKDFLYDNVVKFVNVSEFFNSNSGNLTQTIMIIAMVVIILTVAEVILTSINFGRRSKTISKLIINVTKFFGYMIMLFSVLVVWGLSAAQVTAIFGAVAIAIGFAAQDVIGDILAGVFNVFENQYSVGDIVELDDFRGRVVEIGFRSLRCQNWKGDVLIIRNSSYDKVINFSKALSTAVCDISIAYSEDILRAEKVIKAISPKLKEKYKAIKEGPFYLGVQNLGDSDVSLRIIAKVRERDRLQVERDLNRELKASFDKNKINIPFPQLVIHKGEAEKFSRAHDRIIGDIIEGKTDKLVEQEGVQRRQRPVRDPEAPRPGSSLLNRPTTSLSKKVAEAAKGNVNDDKKEEK